MTSTETVEEPIFHLTKEEINAFKRDLLATVYNQTNTHLQLYQRARKSKLSPIKAKSKLSLTLYTKDNEPIVDEQILNDIQFDKEMDALRNIYEKAFNELNQQNTEDPYQITKLAIEQHIPRNNEIDQLSIELLQNKSKVKELKMELKNNEKQANAKLQEKTDRIELLRSQLSNIKRINQLELRLVEKWEQNRNSQATILGEREERSLMQQILELHRNLAGEQRLICEVESFRKHEYAQLTQQLKDWEEKFKLELKDVLQTNDKIHENMEKVMKSYEKHSEIYAEHKQFVEEYLAQKAEEQRLYEEQMHRVECAIRIQAWWRGTMVRRGLGPFRKKTKKGKKGKSKK